MRRVLFAALVPLLVVAAALAQRSGPVYLPLVAGGGPGGTPQPSATTTSVTQAPTTQTGTPNAETPSPTSQVTVTSGPTSPPTATDTSSPTPTQTPVPVELLPNGDFEQGAAVWQGTLDAITDEVDEPVVPHSGAWVSEFEPGPGFSPELDSPTLTISADRPYLSYWVWIQSTDSACGDDRAAVILFDANHTNGITVDTFNLCAQTQTSGWVRRSANLSSYVGQSKTVALIAGTFDTNAEDSIVYMDDVAFQATP